MGVIPLGRRQAASHRLNRLVVQLNPFRDLEVPEKKVSGIIRPCCCWRYRNGSIALPAAANSDSRAAPWPAGGHGPPGFGAAIARPGPQHLHGANKASDRPRQGHGEDQTAGAAEPSRRKRSRGRCVSPRSRFHGKWIPRAFSAQLFPELARPPGRNQPGCKNRRAPEEITACGRGGMGGEQPLPGETDAGTGLRRGPDWQRGHS